MAIKNSILLTRIALVSLQTWLGSSYVFLLSTGVLQGIPTDLYEAANIDGATVWQIIKNNSSISIIPNSSFINRSIYI